MTKREFEDKRREIDEKIYALQQVKIKLQNDYARDVFIRSGLKIGDIVEYDNRKGIVAGSEWSICSPNLIIHKIKKDGTESQVRDWRIEHAFKQKYLKEV